MKDKLTAIPTKMYYELLDEDEIQNVHFEVQLNNHQLISKTCSSAEGAVSNFQKVLPDKIKIICCQSCRHGNFNPFGDLENQIFCLKDKTLNNREDVVDIFAKQDQALNKRSRKLLDYCNDYKPISRDQKYTYNDWDLVIK